MQKAVWAAVFRFADDDNAAIAWIQQTYGITIDAKTYSVHKAEVVKAVILRR